MNYQASSDRYDEAPYRRCGRSGLRLPAISLGLWHNFGSVDVYENAKRMAETAFDHGITHFDLANNYGPEPGSAELTMGRILRDSLGPYRDELIISSKAGYLMWPGPYGEWGSRKNLIASCDQSLQRLGLDYVDIFYHHRPDPDTPIEESMLALDQLVRSGKALYAGISKSGPEGTAEAIKVLRANKTPFVIHQVRYSMLDRAPETGGLFKLLHKEGVGAIVFSPLAQGLLSDRYLKGVPAGSRATRNHFLKKERITLSLRAQLNSLNEVAAARGQSLAEMALAWVLRLEGVTSALVGASRPEQILDSLGAVKKLEFSAEELKRIEEILKD